MIHWYWLLVFILYLPLGFWIGLVRILGGSKGHCKVYIWDYILGFPFLIALYIFVRYDEWKHNNRYR